MRGSGRTAPLGLAFATFGEERHDKRLTVEHLSNARQHGCRDLWGTRIQARSTSLKQTSKHALDREQCSQRASTHAYISISTTFVPSFLPSFPCVYTTHHTCRHAKSPMPRSWMPCARLQGEVLEAAAMPRSIGPPQRYYIERYVYIYIYAHPASMKTNKTRPLKSRCPPTRCAALDRAIGPGQYVGVPSIGPRGM